MGREPFTAHRRGIAVPLLWVLACVSLVEAAAVHLVLVERHPGAAWIVTALSVGGAAWCVATVRSLARNPLLVRSDTLLRRAGTIVGVAPDEANAFTTAVERLRQGSAGA